MAALIRSTTLVKSRVGVACGMTSSTLMPIPSSFGASALAVLVPNSLSSWTRIALFAGLPAFLLMASSAVSASAVVPDAFGNRRNVFFRPRVVMLSAIPLSMQKGRLYFAAACVAARQIALAKQPVKPATPCSFIWSTRLAPISGRLCASPSTASSFAPPMLLMPPSAFTSSMATCPPVRQSCPP